MGYWAPSPSSWLQGKPGVTDLKQVATPASAAAFFQEAAGSFLAERLFFIIIFIVLARGEASGKLRDGAQLPSVCL